MATKRIQTNFRYITSLLLLETSADRDISVLSLDYKYDEVCSEGIKQRY